MQNIKARSCHANNLQSNVFYNFTNFKNIYYLHLRVPLTGQLHHIKNLTF